MSTDILIEPMDENCILWHCLHGGPVAIQDIGKSLLESENTNWKVLHKNNFPLLKKIIQTYGSCAILAKLGDKVVGSLRFYPKILNEMELSGTMCLQQFYPAGPSEKFIEEQFPTLDKIKDKTLAVHCLIASRPYETSEEAKQAGARKGVGLKLVLGLIDWARENGWKRIVTRAHADLDCMYGQYGAGGKRFWEKAGFKAIESNYEQWTGPDKWIKVVETEAKIKGISNKEAWSWHQLAYEL